MRPVTREERAVGAILDLVTDAVRAQHGGVPTLDDMKEYCHKACKIVAALRTDSHEDRNGLRHNWVEPLGRHWQCWF